MTTWSDPSHDVAADMRRYVEAYVKEQMRAGRLEEEALVREAIWLSDVYRLHRLHLVDGSWAGPAASVASIWRLQWHFE